MCPLLTEEQEAFKQSIIKFARNELNKNIVENDDNAYFDQKKWKKCADMGLLSLTVPEEFGGTGADPLTVFTALQALSYACKDNGLVHAIITQTCCLVLLSLFGNIEQKKKYYVKMGSGDLIAAQAITEPDAGSDISSMSTKSKKKGDEYILNGRKTFTTNGPIADVIFVFAVTNPDRPIFGGVSCLIAEKNMVGFHREKPVDKMGLKTLQNGDLIFEDCHIPFSNLIGKEGQGMIIFNEVIEWERALMATAHLGSLEKILELCINYANIRTQFGQPIGKFQSISNKMVDMKINLELGKMIVSKIGWLKSQKKRASVESSIAKLFVSESLKKAAMEAIQIHGAYGYMKEFEIERELRDSIAATIYSGTSEVQKNIISKLIGL
ncbi:MAG: acyl-CoA dehydrogenase family protein [Ignavibacteria bacterium]|nr:acyl-CoA dehydrogenase family protein [Ignavibacteria bacterium]